jgi:hypothetical protein
MNQPRVIPQKFFGAPALSQQLNEEFHRQASAFHDWLTDKNSGVTYDALSPFHDMPPERRSLSGIPSLSI